MKRKIVASGSYTLMIVSYIPRQPLREYKTNNGQKERKMFLFLVMIHLSIMISSFCVWAEFLVLGYVYSGYGTGWNLHCVLAAVQRASPSFVWICVQLWLYRYVYLESRYISSIFMIFVTKSFYKKTCSLIFNEQVFCKIIII